MDWRDLERFPEAKGDTWQLRRGKGRVQVGKDAVDAAVARWHVNDPLLIGRPGARRFLPVLAVEECREPAQRSLNRRQRALIAVTALVGCLLAASGWAADRPSALRAAVASLAIAAFAALEYELVTKRPSVVLDRSLLTLWVVDRGRSYALGWTAMMVVVGALQLLGERALGGREALELAIGVVNARVLDGEVWRLVVGPFLHADFAHWFGNLALLVLCGAVAGALLRRASIALFFVASTLGALVSTLLSDPARLEAYVGVSAGIFALLGWCCGAAMRRPRRFPAHFAATALGFSIVSLATVWLLNPAASNVGHLTGLAAGIVAGLLVPCAPANKTAARKTDR